MRRDLRNFDSINVRDLARCVCGKAECVVHFVVGTAAVDINADDLGSQRCHFSRGIPKGDLLIDLIPSTRISILFTVISDSMVSQEGGVSDLELIVDR